MNSLVKALAVMILAAVVPTCGVCGWDRGSSIGYSIVPRLDHLTWDDDIGLDDAFLYGVEFGASLDRLVALRGYLLNNSGVSTDLTRISTQFIDQDIGLTSYGLDVVLNLGQGRWVPFLYCGGGILRLDPDRRDAFNQIAMKAGGGLRYEFVPGFTCQASIEDVRFRVDRTTLSAHDPEQVATTDPDRTNLRNNLEVSVGLGVDLGQPSWRYSDAPEQGIGGRLAGGRWSVEAFSGRLRFEDPTDLGDHELVGGRLTAGISTNLALCGYFWRGITEGYGAAEDLQSYGGEAQFFLGRGTRVVPYLLMGAGKLDFLTGFRDLKGRERDDKTMLIAGAGMEFMITDNLRLSVDARDYMLSEVDLDEVGDPDQLCHSFALTGSLGFVLSARGPGRPAAQQVGQSAPEGVRAPDRSVPVAATPLPVEEQPAVQQVGPGEPADLRPSYHSDQLLTLPVPTVGEIYIRYGEPGAGVIVTGQAAAAAPEQGVASLPGQPADTAMPAAPVGPIARAAASRPVLSAVQPALSAAVTPVVESSSPDVAFMPVISPATASPSAPVVVNVSGTPAQTVDREALRTMIDEQLASALRQGGIARPESLEAADREAWRRMIDEELAIAVRAAISARPEMPPEDSAAAADSTIVLEVTATSDGAGVPTGTVVARSPVAADSTVAPASPMLPDSTITPAGPMAPDLADVILARIADALDKRVEASRAQSAAAIVEQSEEVVRTAPGETLEPVVLRPAQPGVVQVISPAPPAAPAQAGRLYAYTGANVDDPAQWVLGGRLDATPIRSGSRIRIAPEVAVGVFNGGSFMLAANAKWDADASLRIGGVRMSPYLYAGAGYIHFGEDAGRESNEGVVNLGYGLNLNFGKSGAYVEHQGIDLFNLSRVNVGVRVAAW